MTNFSLKAFLRQADQTLMSPAHANRPAITIQDWTKNTLQGMLMASAAAAFILIQNTQSFESGHHACLNNTPSQWRPSKPRVHEHWLKLASAALPGCHACKAMLSRAEFARAITYTKHTCLNTPSWQPSTVLLNKITGLICPDIPERYRHHHSVRWCVSSSLLSQFPKAVWDPTLCLWPRHCRNLQVACTGSLTSMSTGQ